LQNITNQIQASIDLKQKVLETLSDNIFLVSNLIVECIKAGGKVVFFGNGGSAADAQHLAGELMGKFYKERKPYPAIALTTNSSIITAIANDYEFSDVFERQVEGLVKEGDIVIGISTSGNSLNVLKGLKKAANLGAKTVGLLGGDGGTIKEVVTVPVIVPSSDTPRVQECHITIGHIICSLVEESLG